MASSENETISLDHIHPKPANLGEQLSITGSRDLLTAANRSSRSRRRVMVILVAIAVAISAIIAAVFIRKYVSEYLSDDNRKGKYQMSLNFRYLFRSQREETTNLNKRENLVEISAHRCVIVDVLSSRK